MNADPNPQLCLSQSPSTAFCEFLRSANDSIYPFFPLLVGLDSPLGAEVRLPSDAVYMHVMYGHISLS